MERLLTTREARQRCAFGLSKWRELLRADPPPFTVIRFNSRLWRIRERDLDEWIKSGCPVPEGLEVTAKARLSREQRAAVKHNGGQR